MSKPLTKMQILNQGLVYRKEVTDTWARGCYLIEKKLHVIVTWDYPATKYMEQIFFITEDLERENRAAKKSKRKI